MARGQAPQKPVSQVQESRKTTVDLSRHDNPTLSFPIAQVSPFSNIRLRSLLPLVIPSLARKGFLLHADHAVGTFMICPTHGYQHPDS